MLWEETSRQTCWIALTCSLKVSTLPFKLIKKHELIEQKVRGTSNGLKAFYQWTVLYRAVYKKSWHLYETPFSTGFVDSEAMIWQPDWLSNEGRLQPGRPSSRIRWSFIARKAASLTRQCFTINKHAEEWPWERVNISWITLYKTVIWTKVQFRYPFSAHKKILHSDYLHQNVLISSFKQEKPRIPLNFDDKRSIQQDFSTANWT
jgi:hypothetical protein